MMHTDLPPLTPPNPNAGQHLDWDRPVGYGHAASILAFLNDNASQLANRAGHPAYTAPRIVVTTKPRRAS